MLRSNVMPAPEDDRFLSVHEITVAAANGHLPLITERLARERSWFARLFGDHAREDNRPTGPACLTPVHPVR